MVELDVRMTADGALAVHHDAVVPMLGAVSDLQVAALPPWLPLLDDAVDACAGMDLNIEIKALPGEPDAHVAPALAEAVAGFIGERGLASRVIVSSFLLATVDAVRLADPAIPTAWITAKGWDPVRAAGTVADRGHAALHPEHTTVTPELVEVAHGLGVAVNAWTCNDSEHMADMVRWGVDGIVSDVPDVLRAVVDAS
jgi:glycerophosphoryl diester phosphodiesterase